MALETLLYRAPHLAWPVVCIRFIRNVYLHCVGRCPELDDPTNGMVEWDSLAPGGVANYTCDSGFILVGDRTRNCSSDGTWSGLAPVCERKFILAPYHLHYSNITSFIYWRYT